MIDRDAPVTKEGLRALARVARRVLSRREDPRGWIEENLWIRTKDRRTIPLRFNPPQVDYYRDQTRRDLILKPRQLGFTTQIESLFFADTILVANTTSVMLAHDMESTQQLFGIAQLFWDRLSAREKRRIGRPKYSNRREFFWPQINSRFFVGTAGAVRFGRGFTINNLHCSEFAFWDHPDEALLAAMEAVPEDGRVIIESTANGIGNPFHDMWLAALDQRSEFAPQFYTWFMNPDYAIAGAEIENLDSEEAALIRKWGLTSNQIRWRRQRMQRLGEKFWQEYPEDWTRCFLASGNCVFNTMNLQRIQGRINVEPAGRTYTMIRVPKTGGAAGFEVHNLAPATLTIWKPPQMGRDYVIGADVGEGLASGDASCACIVDWESGEQVAELHGRVSPAAFGKMLFALGQYYLWAWIGVERNNHGHSTLNTLYSQMRYPYLYRHVAYDSPAGRARQVQLGWPTTASTKPIMVDGIVEAVNTGAMLVRSPGLVGECFTFIRNDTGNAEAQEGKYDDRVIAAAIAWQLRKRPRPRMSSQRPAGM